MRRRREQAANGEQAADGGEEASGEDQAASGTRGLYAGSVPIDSAGPNLLRFCPDCFQAMEVARLPAARRGC